MKSANLFPKCKSCNFLNYAKYYMCLIIALIIAAVAIVSTIGFSLDFDYNGGTIFTVVYENVDQAEKFNEAENKFESILDKYDVQSTSYQYEETAFGKALVVKTLNKDEAANANVVADAFSEFGYDDADLIEKNYISSSVVSSSEKNTTKMAAIALAVVIALLSLIAIFRFNLKTALVYLLSTIIDIVIVIAMVLICRIPINLSINYAIISTFAISSFTKILLFVEIQKSLKDENLKALTTGEIINISLKNIFMTIVMISCVAILAYVLVAGLGTMPIKSFALSALFGTVFSLLTTIFVSSSFCNWLKIKR